MDLKDKEIEKKVDDQLHRVLSEAEGSEMVRAIVTLRPQGEAQEPPKPLDPADFPDRIAYRKAAIEQRAQTLHQDVGEVRRKLEDLELTVKGGVTSPVVVVEGTAEKLLRSLDLEGVGHASLDRKIELQRPTRATGGEKAGDG